MTLEEAQDKILELEESKKQLETEKEALTTQLNESKERILSLQEHNQKLFLKLTSEPEKPEEDEVKTLSPQEIADKFKGGLFR